MGSYAIAKENSLDYSIVSLLGVQDYKVNQKFIQKLFENQEEFLNGVGEPDLYKISKILKEDGKIEAQCHFCHKKYIFTEKDLI